MMLNPKQEMLHKIPNIFVRILHRLNLTITDTNCDNTYATYEIKDGMVELYGYEYRLNKLTNKLDYTLESASAPMHLFLEARDAVKDSPRLDKGEAVYLNEEGTSIISLDISRFLFYSNLSIRSLVTNTKGRVITRENFDMKISKFHKLCKEIEECL